MTIRQGYRWARGRGLSRRRAALLVAWAVAVAGVRIGMGISGPAAGAYGA